MAIHCSHCGVTLQSEDTRFCSQCGNSVHAHSGAKVSFAPVMGQELSPDFTKKSSFPEENQASSLLDGGGGTPDLQAAVVSSLSICDVPESDGGEIPRAFRQEESIIPVSEDFEHLDNIDIHKSLHGEIDQDPHVETEEESGKISIVPVQEDSIEKEEDKVSVVPVQEDNTEEEKVEAEEQDDEAIRTAPVPSHQAYMDVLDSTSARKEVQNVLLAGLVNKLRSRFGLWLTVLLVALIIVGVVYWLLIVQLAPNTDPWQRFSNTTLGFSVLYPTDWQAQVANKPAIVHFYDSTQTDKMDITVSAATSDVAQFLQQQASQLGMTNVTSKSSLSFAGSSWQQVQGKVSQRGVSYSVDLLATTHGHHLYLLTQIAPQSTYDDEDALIFSSMRAGLQFL